MSDDRSKAMQEALEAAVRKMNEGDGGARMDPMALLATVLPRLLGRGDEGPELAEQLEALKKEELGALREQLSGLRKQVRRSARAQQALIEQLRELEQQQSAVAEAVLELARQMSRVRIIDGEAPAPGPARRAAPPPPPPPRPRQRAEGEGTPEATR